MLVQVLLILELLVSSAQAVFLYVASYNGNLTTLSLVPKIGHIAKKVHQHTGKHPAQEWKYNLRQIDTFNTSVQSPSWLTLNKQNNILYLIDEATQSGNGTLVSYKTSATGSLAEIQRVEALEGGVHATFFSSGSALVVPHYIGSSLQTYAVDSTGHMSLLETFIFSMAQPGPVPNRQDSPHPHQAILDPTGQYILIPDLGADLVRVFSIDPVTNKLTATAPLQAEAGSGPRHAAFSLDPISGDYVFYLAGEIAATVTAYRVKYLPNASGLSFRKIRNAVYNSLGPGHAVPPTTTGESTGVTAEIAFSPDGNFLIVSNRRDLSFNASTHPISYPTPSDSLSAWSFAPGATNGALQFLELFPAGGGYPRQFSMNRAGNLLAVGLQASEKVVIIERDVETGCFKRQVAAIKVAGPVVCVVWDE